MVTRATVHNIVTEMGYKIQYADVSRARSDMDWFLSYKSPDDSIYGHLFWNGVTADALLERQHEAPLRLGLSAALDLMKADIIRSREFIW